MNPLKPLQLTAEFRFADEVDQSPEPQRYGGPLFAQSSSIHHRHPHGGDTLPTPLNSHVTNGLGTAVLMISALHGISPVLRTLTYSFAPDSVLFLSVVCFTLHLTLFDYSYSSGSSGKFEGVVSLNMAVFGSVLLSSLLKSCVHCCS
eukprot:SAG25_NODE_853_length_5069_cov_10.802012_5_plen_147_part_00